MTMRASLIITARDQASSAFGRITARARAMLTRLRGVDRAADGAGNSLNRFGSGRALASINRIASAALRASGRLGLKALELGAYGAGRGIGSLIRKAGSWAMTSAKIGVGALVGAAGFGAGGIIKAVADMDTLISRLTRIEGSALKAKQGLAWVGRFSTSPQGASAVADLREAFISLRKAGIDPTNGSLARVQDMAIETKRSMIEVAEVLRDAKLGEFEGLEALDIQAQKQKGQVLFTWLDKQGQRVTKSVKDNAQEVEGALLGIFAAKAGGAAVDQARTIHGLWQRIKNTIGSFTFSVGAAGFLDKLRERAAGLLALFNKWGSDGTLDEWAKRVSDGLSEMTDRAWTFIRDTDWKSVADGMGAMVSVLSQTLSLLGKIYAKAMEFNDYTAKNKLLEQDPLSFLGPLNPFPAVATRKKDARPAPVARPTISSKPMSRPDRVLPVNRPNGGSTRVGGTVEIRLRNETGARASVTRLSSNSKDVPIRVLQANRGPVSMG